jgi:hypothetical protein
MAKIKITFKKENGVIVSETNGMKGASCVNVDSFLGQLGAVKTQLSSEYYENGQPKDVLINTQQG